MNKANGGFRVFLPHACALLLSFCILSAHLQFMNNQPVRDSNRYLAGSDNRDSCARAQGNWSFDRANEWGDFAYVDEDSAELVIGLSDAKLEAYVELSRIIDKDGGQIVNTVSTREVIWAVVADVPFDLIPSFVNNLKATGLAEYIEPNLRFQTQFIPDDPDWPLQWGHVKIEADYAWNTTIGDPSILVAIIDTGIDYDHPDLAGNYVALGYDWVNNDPDPMDDNGHGTHCAGIAAAVINNGRGVAGLAQARIMAEKGFDESGTGWNDDLAQAIFHAVDQGANILSNSWRGYDDGALIHDAVKFAHDNGVLVVAAAGNEAWSLHTYPAAYDEVIAVTATDQFDVRASFSNFGDWVELAAPGVNIYSTYWDDTYMYLDGTSMSTPHVSGVAALIWSQFPYMTCDQVRAQLRRSAEDLGDPGFDDYYGYGRINARRAVEQSLPDHDILIFDYKRPSYVKLGELTTFNVTVLNFGTSNEHHVDVQLLVNGSLADSTSIAFLPSGRSEPINLSWTPIAEVTCNVTSYVVPVPGETIIHNNVITEMIIPGEHPTVSISLSNVTDYDLTPHPTVTLRPDGDGTFHDWIGTPTDTYDDWDDEIPDGDSSYFHTNYAELCQSSTLQNASATETWSIARLKIVIVAKGQEGSFLQPIIVIGGEKSCGEVHELAEQYLAYTSDYGINPATGDYWTWSDINAIEAAVVSKGGEIWVTQLYVEVSGSRLAIDLVVENVENLWGFQFELAFNPDVIQGVCPINVTTMVPWAFLPFIFRQGGLPIRGAGWSNTVGKLSLAGAINLGISGEAVLATLIFNVVGFGETEIRLGENTALMDYAGEWISYGREYVQDGYFRNIDSALMPTAAFTFEPVDTPPEQGPLEGHNTTFTSISIPAPDRTITTYRWYFWTSYRDKLESSIVTDAITVTHNYTRRGTWNVTLTVIDDQGVVATTTSYVDVKAHDVAITRIKAETAAGGFEGNLEGIPCTEIEDILVLNVTVENQGDFIEETSVSCFWSAYYKGEYHYGPINQSIETPTHVENLLPGEKRILTFYWDTTGRNLTHLIYHIIHANASRVPYEYDTERHVGKIAENEFVDHFHRIIFHDIAITKVETNATAVYAGEIVEFKVTVVNQGDYNQTGITVTLYNETDIIGSQSIPLMTTKTSLMKLWKNYTTTLTFIWDTTDTPWANYTIKAEVTWPGWATEDYEPHDNTFVDTFYVKIVGDVDGDGDVDGFDLTYMCGAYGATPGHPKWDEECDINGDSIIDGFDLTPACGNYGKTI